MRGWFSLVGLPQGDSPFLLDNSYTITADITIPEGDAEGMILTSEGRFCGYGFYLLKGKPVFLWNLIDLKRIKWEGPEALTPGDHAERGWQSCRHAEDGEDNPNDPPMGRELRHWQ